CMMPPPAGTTLFPYTTLFRSRQGVRVALNTLVHGGKFVLIAGEDGQPWVDAARKQASKLGIDLVAVRVGILSGDYVDARCAWTRSEEHTSELQSRSDLVCRRL